MQKGFMMKQDTIRFFRACCGYTQQEVAEAVAISVKRYASLESGETEPTDEELSAFAKLYGVSLTTFTQEDYLNETFSISTAFDPALFPTAGQQAQAEEYINRLTQEEKTLLRQYRMLSEDDREKAAEAVRALLHKEP